MLLALVFPQGGNVILNAATAPGNTYQWKKDGVNIMGAISESYTATVSGTYTIGITNADGCQVYALPRHQTNPLESRLLQPLLASPHQWKEIERGRHHER